MSAQQPKFWPKFNDERFRFAPVYKGPSWLAVLKVHDLDDGLSSSEVSGLLELGFMQGSQGRLIYPQYPNERLVQAVSKLLKGDMEVLVPENVVVLNESATLKQAIPAEMVDAIAWFYANRKQMLGGEVRRSLRDNGSEEAEEWLNKLDAEQFINPDRLRGWVASALSGEVTPVTEPILGLAAARVSGAYNGEAPEEIVEWLDALAEFRGEEPTRAVSVDDISLIRPKLKAPQVGELVQWGSVGNKEAGRVVGLSVEYPGSAWVAPSTPKPVEGLLIPSKQRIQITELDGYQAADTNTAPISEDAATQVVGDRAPKAKVELKRGLLTLDDIASEDIRNLTEFGLLTDRVKAVIRGVYKTGLIRGRTPFLGEEGLKPNDMVSHWHFVRKDLDAELGGETPQVRDATAYLRNFMMQEFNDAQPELPGAASDVFAVIPVETTRMGASEELEKDAIQEKVMRETVYAVGFHPRFIRSLDRDGILDQVEAVNDNRIRRALGEALKALTITPLYPSSFVPTATVLATKPIQQQWSSFDPAQTSDSDYEAMVAKHGRGQLFFSSESAGQFLVEALQGKGHPDLVKNNESVITSVSQLSGESHQAIEALPHPLFLLAEQVRRAGVLDKGSNAEVLAALNIDLRKSLKVMGDLATLAGVSLPVVNSDIIREDLADGQLGPTRSEMLAGIINSRQQGPRPFSIAITAITEQLPDPSMLAGTSEAKIPLLYHADENPRTTVNVSLGYLVNLNTISPLRFGDDLGDKMLLTDEALGSIEPNWFEVDDFNSMYAKRSLRNVLDAGEVRRVDDMPALGGEIETPISEIANRLGVIEKGMQAILGSWRSDEKAREALLDGVEHWLNDHRHFKNSSAQRRIAESMVDDLESVHNGEMIALLTKKTSRNIKYQSTVVTSEDISESQFSRAEAAEFATLRFKNRSPRYGKFATAIFDAMSVLRPEALKYLNDQRIKAEKEAAKAESGPAPKEAVKRGARQNKGLVAGLSMKDLRGKTETVLNHLSSSSDLDQEKLCKKTKLWEAPDWVSLREGSGDTTAMEPAVASFFNELRKGLQSGSPVNAKKINLLYAKAILQLRDFFNETRTYADLEEKVNGSLAEAFTAIEKESTDLGVSPDLILSSGPSGWVVNSNYLGYMLRKANSRTNGNTQWPNELIQKRAAFRGGAKDDTGAMPALTKLVRKGAPDYRAGEDIDEETLIRTFGFSGVEYGESMPQAERTTYLNYAYDGFRDLAAALEANPKSLSFGGTLGLAFGSRGRGGRRAALAHYEPSNNVINLTRMKGAGSMAHEYGHALANYFSRMVSSTSRGPGDLAESVSSGLNFKPMSKEAIGGLRKEIHDAFAVIMANTRYTFESESVASDLNAISATRFPESDFKKGAGLADAGRKKKYWSTPAEMFARSFETWINEKLKSTDGGFQNDFLVRPDKLNVWGTSIRQQREEGVKEVRPQLYPSGDQLQMLSKAFGSLVKSMKEGTKRVEHEHLGEIDMPYLYSRDTGSIQRLHKEDMGPIAQCVMGDLARMCGHEIEVQFHKELKDDHGNAVAGRFSSIEGPDYEPSNGLRGLVELAYGAPMGVAWHEGFHYAQRVLFNEQERECLDYSFTAGNELHNRLIDSLIRDGKENLAQYCDNPKEAQAYAYEQWMSGSLDMKIEEQPRTLFGEMKGFFKRVLGVSESAGFSTPEQLFQSFYDGRLAARANLQQSLSQEPVGKDNFKYQTLELKEGDLVVDDMDEPEHGSQFSPV